MWFLKKITIEWMDFGLIKNIHVNYISKIKHKKRFLNFTTQSKISSRINILSYKVLHIIRKIKQNQKNSNFILCTCVSICNKHLTMLLSS